MNCFYNTDAGFKQHKAKVLFIHEDRAIIAVLKEHRTFRHKINYVIKVDNANISDYTYSLDVECSKKEIDDAYEIFNNEMFYDKNGCKVFTPTKKEFKALVIEK